jgi:hypothetical protein
MLHRAMAHRSVAMVWENHAAFRNISLTSHGHTMGRQPSILMLLGTATIPLTANAKFHWSTWTSARYLLITQSAETAEYD